MVDFEKKRKQKEWIFCRGSSGKISQFVTLFCGQQENVGCGLLQGAFWDERGCSKC